MVRSNAAASTALPSACGNGCVAESENRAEFAKSVASAGFGLNRSEDRYGATTAAAIALRASALHA